MEEKIVAELKNLGVAYTAPVTVSEIKFFPELRALCEMNSCGYYDTNWGCPPGCGPVEELAERCAEFPHGIVYQLVGKLEDSFDYEGMTKAGLAFGNISDGIRQFMRDNATDYLVLGAGGCKQCGGACTYPDDPCRFPHRRNVSVESCGINVSLLCEQCGLDYIHGPNTVTNTGLVLYK